MGRLVVVTGGARSGKSTFAEMLAKDCKCDVVYIATSIPFDDEMKARIKKHIEQRPKNWKTVEAYKDIDKHLAKEKSDSVVFLLDCITIMITNIMLEASIDWDGASDNEIDYVEDSVKVQIEKVLKAVKEKDAIFILVTNEIGMGIVPENKLSRIFRDIAGRINQILASAADEVYLCVSGIPVKIK
ncbi:bifunctional adenosylcobinamide kinase/adenosylcobinamide-phosphate guanylyltransferase [Acetivibrio cellulolyticus]|uniref:bifunctional adenosylcobinamide kinase/adenosylcobinamide-phosphate guanylyltransferase n=1 Tax=Acetivibrio cellulolyticus TaxID=35830 RepID=UPI0001E2DEF8|nr:bifunctional adenosylcobinamide kinase/adenosylcobinamide-phosphate guanylyltransferase [Acetivibrio cellulolyticus]